jgi:phospholipid/cholesterol/gamma-HCH transport system ATP-binding protein
MTDQHVTNHDNLIEVRNLRFQFCERWIFNDIDIDIPRGKITAIMGPSGTGKTTLLRLIGGQLYPASGSINLNDKNIPKLNRADLFTMRREIGMLFQSGALFTDLNVYENVAFPLRVHTQLSEAISCNCQR